MNLREFKNDFEELGYTFQSIDVLEDVYLFYKYYDNKANEGVASILLEGDPGSGKTFLSEVFSSFLGEDTEYIYTQCVEETNSDRLIATYNVPAIVKGEADKALAAGILTRAILLANEGKKVVLTIDELDKAREVLDSYFLDFLQSGKIETSDNEILALTEEGRKNLFVIFAKNEERELSDPLLRRCSVIKLPPMPPVLAYKTLLKKLENVNHDSKFLRFVSKVYEAIYNEQIESNGEFLSRMPALQELITAITGDYELYENNISSTRRIKNLVRKLGKDDAAREIITNVLIKKFKYQNKESNYNDGGLDYDLDSPDDYMNNKDSESLVEQYIEKKDNGEYIFEEDEFEDPMKDVASILDNMKDDQSLVFMDKENKEKIVELGVITHKNPEALNVLFDKIKFKGNPNSRFGFLNFEDDNFIGLMKYKDTLILVSNKEYVSPRLLMRGLSTIISIIYDSKENVGFNMFYFSSTIASDFKLAGLNAKILSNIPTSVLNKMTLQHGVYTYQTSNLKITYDDSLDISYFRYLQKYRAEPLFEAIENMCRFNPELAIPVSIINAKTFPTFEKSFFDRYSYFQERLESLDKFKKQGWEIEIDDFEKMDLSFPYLETKGNYWYEKQTEISVDKDSFVFEVIIDYDNDNKKIHVYPKYSLNSNYLLYTNDSDFENDEVFKQINPFQKEIAFFASSIFGNFIPKLSSERQEDYFSPLTMAITGKIVEDKNYRNNIYGIGNNITEEPAFINYYDSISSPTTTVTSEKILKRTLK